MISTRKDIEKRNWNQSGSNSNKNVGPRLLMSRFLVTSINMT